MLPPLERASRLLSALVLAGAAVIAYFGARPFAGGWNDGSRLASVEAIADHHTLAIDDSIFVRVPPGSTPYPADPPFLQTHGTRDRLWIDGRFYSDKPYVASFFMAGLYRLWQALGGPTASDRPDLFCLYLTWATSGLAYVVAVWCIWRLGKRLRLDLRLRLVLTASFALATVAPAYARHMNNHILLLAVASALFLQLAALAEDHARGRTAWGRLFAAGTLTGLGYTLDQGAGPVLLLCVGVLVAVRWRRAGPVLVWGLAALPWVLFHHAVNYAVGGTLGPANAVPAYLAWPGSPFSTGNMTGMARHGPVQFVVYALALLFGKKGFVGHNLALFLLLPALPVLLRRARPEVVAAAVWMAGTWLLYALMSNNYSGGCLSVRWFVPLLAPAYYLLGQYLRDHPERIRELAVLGGVGAVLGLLMWLSGPWWMRTVPLYWPIQALALGGCVLIGRSRRSIGEAAPEGLTYVRARSRQAPAPLRRERAA